MCGIGEALNNLFPTGWLDPYGSMPLNKEYSVQIDITQVETDDGIKITAVKTPPRASTTSVQDAINMALGIGCCNDKENVENRQSESKGKEENCQSAKTQKDKQDYREEDKSTDKESENDNESFGNDNKQHSNRGQRSETGRSRSSR